MIDELKELFEENLHNIEFKKKIIAKLEELVQEGSLKKIIEALSDQQQFINDHNDYHKACKQAKILEQQINTLNGRSSDSQVAVLFGQKMTVLLSYVLCFIVTVTVIM